MRYFAEISYHGGAYHGWQRQPNSLGIQQVIEEKLSLLLRQPTGIIGCGRTDTGVHASQYYFHFDAPEIDPSQVSHRLKRFLPADISCKRIFRVADNAHARFDATRRAYVYRMHRHKDPFLQGLSYQLPDTSPPALTELQAVADLIANASEFAPFCKTHHDAKTLQCTIMRSEWMLSEDGISYAYHIAANRFLRGMVRLIVGACLQVAQGQIALAEVEEALNQQTPLRRSLSAPAHGLYLCEVLYGG